MPYMINMKDFILNGITDELTDLETNGNIVFSDSYIRSEFIADLLSEILEQFENDIAYYGHYNPNFTDAVSDKIQWDSEYYGLTILK